MIKYFQKLKAKKGFTLVELIVVIAIIGVLAAILIPTMLGYVTSSRVTSANTTAASIKNSIDNFLTDADTAGYGMKQSSKAIASIEGSWVGGKLTIKVGTGMTVGEAAAGTGTGAFKEKSAVGKWENSGEAEKDTKKTGENATQFLAIQLKGLFPDITTGSFIAHLVGGKTMYCAYTADVATGADFPKLDDFEKGFSSWNGATAGVSSEGYIIGSAPALTLKVASGS